MAESEEKSVAEADDTATADLSAEDLFIRLKGWFKDDVRHRDANWTEEAREDFDFYAGDQWSDDDKAALKEQLRPPVVFNRVQKVMDHVSGSEINNRQDVHFYAREVGDAVKSELLSEGARYFRDEANAEDEESDAYFDAAVCGMGWVENRMDYANNPQGDYICECIDPFEMVWDNAAAQSNLIDARRIFRVRDMGLQEARDLFPGEEDFDLDAAWARGESEHVSPHNVEGPRYDDTNSARSMDATRDRVTIVHAQWREMEDGKYVVKQVFLGGKVLSEVMPTLTDEFHWNCITGKRDRNKRVWFGMVRGMKDPQRWANKWLSQTMHILNSQAGAGYFAEQGALADVKQAQRTLSKPNAITVVTPGALTNGRIQPKAPQQVPAGTMDLMQFAVSSVPDVAGVNLEALGQADREQAGVLEWQRRKAAMTALAKLLNSLKRFRKRQGKFILDLMMRNMADGRLVRVVGDERAQYVPLLMQPGVAEFDVVIDDAPSSPDQKEQTWGIIQELLPIVAPAMGPDLWAMILPYSPLPASLSEKLSAKMQEMAQQPQPDPEQKKLEAQMQIEQMKLEGNAQIKQQELQMKAGLEQQKLSSQAQLQAVQADREAAIEQTQAAADIETQRQKSQLEMAIQERHAQLEERLMLLEHSLKMQQARMDMAQQATSHAMQSEQQAESHKMSMQAMKAKAKAVSAKPKPKAK